VLRTPDTRGHVSTGTAAVRDAWKKRGPLLGGLLFYWSRGPYFGVSRHVGLIDFDMSRPSRQLEGDNGSAGKEPCILKRELKPGATTC